METSISEYLTMHSTVLLMGFQNFNIVKSISKEYNAVRFGVAFVVFLLPGICGGDIYLGQRDRQTDGHCIVT